ncbi:hypothetical protein MMC07_006058 [Pseudocyphellaria aurata]|nr:hypothetical protein [Pseudocyphellaria aurata]
MKFSTIAATASFLTLVSTKPLAGKHHHNHPRAIVYETFTTEVLEIEYASTTVWVTAGESSSPTTTPVHKKLASKKTSASAPSPAATTVEAPAPSATAEAPPPPATTTETPAPLATTESSPPPPSTPEQPSSTPAAAVPPPSSTPAAAVPPPSSTPALVVPPPSSTLALVVPPSSTPAPYVPPPPPSTPPSTSPSGGSSTSSCGQVGGQCSGDITFYDILPGQYGACGFEDVNGLTDDIVALPFGEKLIPFADPSSAVVLIRGYRNDGGSIQRKPVLWPNSVDQSKREDCICESG